MKKGRFTEEQIIEILKESDSGVTNEEIYRKHKIAANTFYVWRRKYKGMQVAEAKRLKDLELENAKMKRLIANQALDILVLKDALGKK
jgi:putative transposase